MAISANARVKKHKRFALIPDAPGAAEHRERMLKNYVPEDLPMAPVGVRSPKPKSPRKPDENVTNPFKVRPRKSSPGRKSNDKEKEETMNNYNLNDFDRRVSLIKVNPSRKSNDEEKDETMNNYDMNDFDEGDAMMGEHPPPLSPVQEVENEDDEDNVSSPRQIVPRKTPKKIHNTRSSSQRTRSEKARYKVDYGSRKSRKSMR